MYDHADDTALPPRLHCEGTRLIKPNGKQLILRGVNLGCPGEDSATDPAEIAALGANCVRIKFPWWGEFSGPEIDGRDNDGFAFLSRAHFTDWIDKITAASAAGLWVIPFIDSDCGQSGTQKPSSFGYCDPHGTWGARGRNFYTDQSMRRLFAQIVWPAAAARLRTIAQIALLEIHAEPAGDRGPEYTPLVSQVQRDIIAAVREVDADTPFLLGARGGYAIKCCDEAFLEERTDCVYTGNLLDQWVVNPEKFDDGLAYLTDMRDARQVPVFVQQLGRESAHDPDGSLMRRALARMEEEGVGATWWQWRQHGTGANGYALNYRETAHGPWLQKADELEALRQAWKK